MDIHDLKFLLAHPDYISYQMELFIKRKIHLKWFYWVGQKQCPGTPQIISLRMNSPEAPEPLLCGQFGSFGISQGKAPQKESSAIMSADRIKKIVDDVAGIKARMYLWGNEPFRYPDFEKILDHIGVKGIHCQIHTRGLLLERYAESLVNLGIDEIIISLDGPPQVYKSMNPHSEEYDTIVRGVRKIIGLKQARKAKKPVLKGAMVIAPENYHYLDDTLTCAEETGLEHFTINFTFATNEQLGQSQGRFFLDTFNCTSDSWEKLKMDVSRIEVSALIRDIMRVKRRKKGIPVSFYPLLKAWQVSDFYKTPEFSAGIDRCKIPWFIMNILETGSVIPCTDYPDFVIGNLNDDALFTCWNNEDMASFRTELIRYGKFPICSKCSGLYLL